MEIELLYGKSTLPVQLPESLDVTVIRKPEMPLLADPARAVSDALRDPVEAPPLAELAGRANSACIVICDVTRPVPNRVFLRPIIETLLAQGMAAEQITVLIATGLHRPNLGEELEEVVGDPWVCETVRVVNHDARDPAGLIDLGATPTRETPVVLNRILVDAELKIVTGLVEPHFMAGWSGGRKLVAPGVAGESTIRTFHNARFMGDPRAANCNLDGNPLHEEQVEILRKLGPVYAVNTVIDEERRLSFINFGEVIASHARSVEFARPFMVVPVDGPFDVVLTSAAGYPLDKTYYQTVKGMVAPMNIISDGGDIIVVSACEEGVGSAEYIGAQERLVGQGAAEFEHRLFEKPLAAIDEWQTQMQLKPMKKCRIHLFTGGLSDADHALTGVETVRDLEEFLDEVFSQKPAPRVAVIPEGPYLVPRLG
jgi:nickel-dependent lactate racemase